jgi:hypothetical protein
VLLLDVGTVEVLDATALDEDELLAVDVDVFPSDVFVTLASDEDELLASDDVLPSDEGCEFVVASCVCIDTSDTSLEEEADALELPVDACAELAADAELMPKEYPFCIMYWTPFTNSSSDICPSLHHLALSFTQDGIPCCVDPEEPDVL